MCQRVSFVDSLTPRLLEFPNIDVNCQDNNGFTLLMNALHLFTKQSFDFAELLIKEKSADLKIKTFSGNNCFHQLAMMKISSKYSGLKFVDYEKYLKLKKTSRETYKNYFNLFVENGIDINEKNLSGHTPLSIALNEKNYLFLELLTRQTNLQVDHLVHDQSELHNFKCLVFEKNSPEILLRIIKKSQDFKLLMQLYNTDNGYNAFHSILNEIVLKLSSHLNSMKSGFETKYQNYLKVFNNLKPGLFQKEGDDEKMEEDDEEEFEIEEQDDSLKIQEEDCDQSLLEGGVHKLKKDLLKIKSNMSRKASFENIYNFFKAKSELYQHKNHNVLLADEEKKLKKQIISIFKNFEKFGYDFSEKVRLYKKKVVSPAVLVKGNQNRTRITQKSSTSSRIRWRDKDYTINVDAKNTVFHILMKKANSFLFDFFVKKVKFEKNECNFLGYSLIHYLVHNYNGQSPKMDIKVHNKDYNHENEIIKKRKIQNKKVEGNKQLASNNQGNTMVFMGGGTGPPTGLFASKMQTSTLFRQPVRRLPAQKKRGIMKNSTKRGTQEDSEENSEPVTTEKSNQEDENVLIMKRLLKFGENPDLHNKQKEYPVIKVCKNGGNAILHLLVQNKVNLNVMDRKGNSPLLIFSKRRDLRSSEYLLENNADIMISDHQGRNALHWSLNQTSPTNSNNFDLEEILIEKGVGINYKDKLGRPPIFYLFSKIGNDFINSKLDPIEMFSYMISLNKLDLEQVDLFGNRLIHYCAQRGSYLCMIYLIREKVRINVLNNHLNSPLNISILNKQNDVAIILLQSNAEVNKSVQIVDYEKMKKYKRHLKAKEKEEKDKQKLKIIEESSVVSKEDEHEEESQLQIEDEEGFIQENIITKFKEDSESESEEEWHEYVKFMSQKKKKKKKQKVEYMIEEEDEEDNEPVLDDTQNNNQFGYYNSRNNQSYNLYDLTVTYQNTWQLAQIKQNLKQNIEVKLAKKQEWEKLEKLAKKNFIVEQGSQFKIALKNSMLSVNFLLVDFKFDLGQAIMDTLSLKNWDYTKTLLNKKVNKNMFTTVDNKGRNIMHYLAFFGKSLRLIDLEYFMEKFKEKNIEMSLKDCLKRKPIHYAALSGNLNFIIALKGLDKNFQEKDIFGNTLLSLYIRSHSTSREILRTFVEDYSNDVNLKFTISNEEFMNEVESFDFWTMDQKELTKKINSSLRKKNSTIAWFDMELKLREGQQVPQTEECALKKYSTLIYAAWVKKDLTLTEYLIEMGADLNIQNELGETILAKAIKENNLNLIEILKKYSDKIDFSIGKVLRI